MKRIALVPCLALLSLAAESSTGYLQHAGANVGGTSTRSFGMAAITANPASGQFLLREDQSFRAGVFSLPHVGYEIGPVDNFMDDIEALEDDLDREGLTEQDAQAIIDEFNPLLVKIGDAAYVNIDLQQQLPVTPMAFHAFGGVIALDMSAEARMRIEILDAPLTLVDNGDGTFDAETDSAAYIRSGVFTRLGASYSRTLPALEWLALPEGASAIVGGRLGVIQGRLSKQVAALDSDDEEDAFDRLEENYSDNERSKTALALDVGTIFAFKSFHVGATLYNLLPPKFEFGAVGVDCASIADPGKRSDCEVAAGFAGEIGLNDGYTDKARLNLEGSYRVLGSNWLLGGSFDVNKTESVVGGEFQWLSATVGYESPNWWAPGFALGYKQNLAGSRLSYLTLGLNLLSALSLNLSYGLETAEHDGDSMPRSAAVAIGFEVPF